MRGTLHFISDRPTAKIDLFQYILCLLSFSLKFTQNMSNSNEMFVVHTLVYNDLFPIFRWTNDLFLSDSLLICNIVQVRA